MLVPMVYAWIEQSHHTSSARITGIDTITFVEIAVRAGIAKVIKLGLASKHLRHNVGNEALEFLAFSRSQTPLIVLVEQPVKPRLDLDIESLQLDRYGGFSDGTGHGLSLSSTLPKLY